MDFVTYALYAWIVVGGQVHAEVLDYDLSHEDCMRRAHATAWVELEQPSESEIVPLECVPEWRA